MNDLIYKVGEANCNKAFDKNGGFYEYNLIKSEIAKLSDNGLEKCFVLVGGNLSDESEYEKIVSLIKRKKDKGYKVIFIATDSISLKEMSIDVINRCDLLLHQAVGFALNNINIEQKYSYVPELFYVDNEKPKVQKDMIFFGGGSYNREDKIKEYLRKDNEMKKGTFSIVKDSLNDERIEYSSLQLLIKMFKFSLIICRKEYRENYWFTPRFIEAVNNWSLPVLDFEYNKNRLYESIEVSSYDEMIYMINCCSEESRINRILDLRKEIKSNRDKFARNIINFCSK